MKLAVGFAKRKPRYRRTEKFRRQSLLLAKSYEGLPPPPDQLQQVVDHAVASQGRMKARQGRLAEGEADVRRALLSRLKATGKYNLQTMNYVGALANLLVEQGRLAEAERLTRTRIEIHEALGVPQGTQSYAGSFSRLASILNLQGRWNEAAEVYAELDAATRSWPAARREGLTLNISQIATLYNTNNLEAGLAAAERLLARNRSRFGEQHVDTALARGMLAIGLAAPVATARRCASSSSPSPCSCRPHAKPTATMPPRPPRASSAPRSSSKPTSRSWRGRARPRRGRPRPRRAFRWPTSIRGSSVQKALAAASARAVAKNPALAELARKAQDLEKQVAAQLGVLNNVLALPPDQRDDKALEALQADIDKLRAARDSAKRDLAGKFRDYANLVDPQSPTIADIRAVLKPERGVPLVLLRAPGELRVGGAQGRRAGVCRPSPHGGRARGQVKHTARGAGARGGDGRGDPAVRPGARARALSRPAAAGGGGLALGQEPDRGHQRRPGSASAFGLADGRVSRASSNPSWSFDGYRQVAWLARTHAVSQVPSAAALRTLQAAAAGLGQARKAHRLRRSLLQPRASRPAE